MGNICRAGFALRSFSVGDRASLASLAVMQSCDL